MSISEEKLSEKYKQKGKGLTPKVFMLGLLITLFGSWFFGAAYESGVALSPWADSDYRSGFSTADIPLAAFAGALILTGILTLVNRVKPIFSKQEMAILVVITLIACATSWPRNPTNTLFEYDYPWSWVAADEYSRGRYVEMYGGTFLCPAPFTDYGYALSVAEGSLSAGDAVPVDWVAWGPLWGYLTLTSVSMGLIGVAVALLVRRMYIDAEAVEFPWGEMHVVGFDQVQSWLSKGSEAARSRYFLLGFVPVFVLYTSMWAPNHLSWLFTGSQYKTWMDGFTWGVPWMPESHPPGNLGIWELNITPLGLSILPWVAITVFWIPHLYGGLYLIPLDALFGASIGVLIMNFIAPITFYNLLRPRGGMFGLATWTKGITMWKAQQSIIRHPGRTFGLFFCFGLMVPLIVLPLWAHRRIFGRIIRGLVSLKAGSEVDPEAPIRYRYVWLIFIGGFLLLLLSFSYAPFVYVFVQQTLNVLVLFGEARILTSGATFGPVSYCTYDAIPLRAPAAMADGMCGKIVTRWFFNAFQINENNVLLNFYGLHYGGIIFEWQNHMGERVFLMIIMSAISLMAFYLAKRMEIDRKDILKTLLMFTVLTLILSNIFRVLMVHWTDVIPPPAGYQTDMSAYQKEVAINISPFTLDKYWQWDPESLAMSKWGLTIGGLLLGVILNSLFYRLRLRFTWVRIDPAGVFLGATLPGLTPAIFIALGLKYATMKIGGVEFYQKIGKPLAVGTLLAWGGSFFLHHGFQALYMWRTAFGIWPY